MKITVTVGVIDGKPVVIKEPSFEVSEHIAALRELTLAGGIIKKGKSEKQVSEAIVNHSTKGPIKRRSFKA